MPALAPYIVPLDTAMKHLVHVVQYADPDGIRVAARRVLAAGGTLDFRFGEQAWTPLTWLVGGGHLRCMALLLSAGASPDFPMDQGHTALHRAVSAPRLDVIELLVAHGASPDRCNDRRETPRALAERAPDPAVRVVLERAELRRLTGMDRASGEQGAGTHRRL